MGDEPRPCSQTSCTPTTSSRTRFCKDWTMRKQVDGTLMATCTMVAQCTTATGRWRELGQSEPGAAFESATHTSGGVTKIPSNAIFGKSHPITRRVPCPAANRTNCRHLLLLASRRRMQRERPVFRHDVINELQAGGAFLEVVTPIAFCSKSPGDFMYQCCAPWARFHRDGIMVGGRTVRRDKNM